MEAGMRFSVDIDDTILDRAAARAPGVRTRKALIEAALLEYVQQRDLDALAEAGGSEPHLTVPPRRRPNARGEMTPHRYNPRTGAYEESDEG